jgi:hypothetical protein
MNVPFLLVVLLLPWSQTEPTIELRQVLGSYGECVFAGQKYELEARGRAQVARTCKPWNPPIPVSLQAAR